MCYDSRKICRNAAEERRKGVYVCMCQDRDQSLAQTMLFLFPLFFQCCSEFLFLPTPPKVSNRCENTTELKPQPWFMIHSLGWGKTMQEIAMVMPVYRGSMGDIGRGQRLESILGFAERLSVPAAQPQGRDRAEASNLAGAGTAKPLGVCLLFLSKRNYVLLLYWFMYFLPSHPVNTFTHGKNA